MSRWENYADEAKSGTLFIKNEINEIRGLLMCQDISRKDIEPHLLKVEEKIKIIDKKIDKLDEENTELSDSEREYKVMSRDLKQEIKFLTANISPDLNDVMKMEILNKAREKYSYEQICKAFPELAPEGMRTT